MPPKATFSKRFAPVHKHTTRKPAAKTTRRGTEYINRIQYARVAKANIDDRNSVHLEQSSSETKLTTPPPFVDGVSTDFAPVEHSIQAQKTKTVGTHSTCR